MWDMNQYRSDVKAKHAEIYLTPLPPPEPKEDMPMMFMKHPGHPELFAVVDVHHIDGQTRDRLIALGVSERLDDMTDAQFDAFNRQAAENA